MSPGRRWRACAWCDQPCYTRTALCRDCGHGSWVLLLILAFCAAGVVIALVDLAIKHL